SRIAIMSSWRRESERLFARSYRDLERNRRRVTRWRAQAAAVLRAAVLRRRALHETAGHDRRPRGVPAGLPRDPRWALRRDPGGSVLLQGRTGRGARATMKITLTLSLGKVSVRGGLLHRRKRRRPQDRHRHLLHDRSVLLALRENSDALGVLQE